MFVSRPDRRGTLDCGAPEFPEWRRWSGGHRQPSAAPRRACRRYELGRGNHPAASDPEHGQPGDQLVRRGPARLDRVRERGGDRQRFRHGLHHRSRCRNACNSTPAINIQNNAIIQPAPCANHCGVAANSSCSNALSVSNNAQVNAPVFVHGQWQLSNNAKLNCTPKDARRPPRDGPLRRRGVLDGRPHCKNSTGQRTLQSPARPLRSRIELQQQQDPQFRSGRLLHRHQD